TYTRIVAEALNRGSGRESQIQGAVDAFYRGFVAEFIDEFVSQPSPDLTGKPSAGFLTGEDLASWVATEEDPVTADFMGLTVHKPDTWSQGPVLLQQLRLLEELGIAELEPLSADWIHTVIESAK